MRLSSHLIIILYFAVVWTLLATPVTQDEPIAVLSSASWAIPAPQTSLFYHHA